VRVTVLERRTEESGLTRAFGVHARTLELLDARGLADELIATGTPVRSLRLFDAVRVDLTRLPSRFGYLLITPQYQVERSLRRRAEEFGATIVRGAEVTGIRQDPEGVDVRVRTGDRTATHRTAYVVGADGVHSRVRETLGLPFPGVSVLSSIMLADVRLAHPPEDVLAVNAVGDCFAFVAPFGDGWYRIFAWNRTNPQPDTAPVDLDEVRDVTRRALGRDLGIHDPRWMSRFHSDERQVPTYRVGRVFLAGDAAHVHSPAGGQGMNTGIQDAVNLGWKLAATLHGWASTGLLDSYHTERHPVGRTVLRSSGALIRLAMIRSRVERAVRNIVGGTALRLGPVAGKVAGVISGVGIGYPAGHGEHPLVGRRAADTLLAGGGQPASRLYEALRAGTFVLLGPPELATVAAGWADRVTVASPADADRPTTLVRPDGYVAWATGHGGTDHADLVRAALTEWCGAPDGALILD
jgi:2-polyprenyl-6-methoxyphenol hydroxylase-like FAD-dependent oxidoreductase